MKMQSEKKAVLHLLNSGNSGKYANQLRRQPWNILENASGKQVEQESDYQKNTRLNVLPMSVYPICENEDEME